MLHDLIITHNRAIVNRDHGIFAKREKRNAEKDGKEEWQREKGRKQAGNVRKGRKVSARGGAFSVFAAESSACISGAPVIVLYLFTILLQDVDTLSYVYAVK